MIDLWWKLNLLLDPAIPKLTPDEQIGRMQNSIQESVLSLYKKGYDPTAIARALTANGVALVIECGGPRLDYTALLEIMAAFEKMLQPEPSRRRMSLPYTPDEQIERMGNSIQELVLGLYRKGYDPTAIARALTRNGIELVNECGGLGRDHTALLDIVTTIERMLLTESSRRKMSPPYDRVAQFVRRHEMRRIVWTWRAIQIAGRAIQIAVIFLVIWSNSVWHWTPNNYLPALLGVFAAALLTGISIRLWQLWNRVPVGSPRPFGENLRRQNHDET